MWRKKEQKKNAEAIKFVLIRSDFPLFSSFTTPSTARLRVTIYFLFIFIHFTSNSTCAWITIDYNYQRIKWRGRKKCKPLLVARQLTVIDCIDCTM